MSGVVVTASAGGGGVACTGRGGLAVGAVGTSGAELGGATGVSVITIADGRDGAMPGASGASTGRVSISVRAGAGKSAATSAAVRPRTIGSLPA